MKKDKTVFIMGDFNMGFKNINNKVYCVTDESIKLIHKGK